MIRNIIFGIGLATMTLTTTACNTVKGLGRDIESVGQAGDDLTAVEPEQPEILVN